MRPLRKLPGDLSEGRPVLAGRVNSEGGLDARPSATALARRAGTAQRAEIPERAGLLRRRRVLRAEAAHEALMDATFGTAQVPDSGGFQA